MKRHWEIDELIENFLLRPEEIALFAGSEAANQLGMAVLLKFFQYEARFPTNKQEVPEEVLAFLAHQLAVDVAVFENYRWASRTIKKHRGTMGVSAIPLEKVNLKNYSAAYCRIVRCLGN